MESGTKSALSTFKMLVQVVWIGLILVCVYLAIGVPVGIANPRFIRPWLGVGFWGPGLVIGLPWESLTPSQWRSFLLPVGSWGLAGTIAVLVAVDQVRRILSGERDKSPFTATNASRVRKAGLAVLCSGAAKAFRDIAFGHFVITNWLSPRLCGTA